MKQKLSPRQKQIVSKILIEGKGLKAIAAELEISHSTARAYMRIIYSRLGVDGMAGFMGKYIDQSKVMEDVA